jgi:hypothetical protein
MADATSHSRGRSSIHEFSIHDSGSSGTHDGRSHESLGAIGTRARVGTAQRAGGRRRSHGLARGRRMAMAMGIRACDRA